MNSHHTCVLVCHSIAEDVQLSALHRATVAFDVNIMDVYSMSYIYAAAYVCSVYICVCHGSGVEYKI